MSELPRLVLAEPYDGLPEGTTFVIVGTEWPVLRPNVTTAVTVALDSGEHRRWTAPGPVARGAS